MPKISPQASSKFFHVCWRKRTLYDNRDGQAYTVSKYKMSADGSKTACWMSNLNLGATNISVNLNSSNTHITNGSTISASAFNSWKKSSSTASYTSPEFIPVNSSSTCIVGYDEELDKDLTASCSEHDSYGNKYGTLYNYPAVSAGTYVYEMAQSPEGVNATSDLCPAGWRLPTGSSSGEYGQLLTGYGGLTTRMDSNTSPTGEDMLATLQSSLGFSLAGYVSGAAPFNQTVLGRYWSSTWYDGKYMYDLYLDLTVVTPTYSYNRFIGYSIRCIDQ